MGLPIIPRQPGFAELALGGLQQALPSIQDLILKQQKDKQIQQILSQIGAESSSENGPGWEHLLALHNAGAGDLATSLAPFAAANYKDQIAEKTEERKKEGAREEIRPVSERLQQLINKLGSQPGNKEMSDELDTLGFWYTDKIYTHFNKGVISNIKFKNLKDTLSPNSSDRPETARAKLRSLNVIAGLNPDISPKNFDKVLDSQIKKVKSIEEKHVKDMENDSNKMLSEEVAIEILREANGNAEKARKIARQKGYQF